MATMKATQVPRKATATLCCGQNTSAHTASNSEVSSPRLRLRALFVARCCSLLLRLCDADVVVSILAIELSSPLSKRAM